jgi:hypothetical protein
MSSISAGTTLTTALVSTGDTTGELVLKTNGTTTAVTIDTSQNVTIEGDLTVNGAFSGTVDVDTVTGTLDVANGGTGATTLTANNVILGNGTSAVSFVAPGTTGNVLTSNGTTWTSAAGGGGGGFPSGTVMLFAQTAAPTGWTKDTSNNNNSALRVVTGTASTGGSVDFTTAFASQTPSGTVSVSGSAGNTTLSEPQIPSHSHSLSNGVSPTQIAFGRVPARASPGADAAGNTGGTGGGGAHSHPLTISSSTFTGNAINLAVKYVDVIRATKD